MKNNHRIYDGQMAMQDVEVAGSTTTVTDYSLGARGIDAVFKTENGSTAVGYPIYDAHGNRTATLTKSGTSFALGDIRSYDAWGNVTNGNPTGRPRARYCANLGHVQDDESDLIYMRARYYEPSCGRFISEDPGCQGSNLFAFCASNPINAIDRTGREYESCLSFWAFAAVMMAGLAPGEVSGPCSQLYTKVCRWIDLQALNAMAGFDVDEKWVDRLIQYIGPFTPKLNNVSFAINFYKGKYAAELSLIGATISLASTYSFIVCCYLVGADMAFEEGL